MYILMKIDIPAHAHVLYLLLQHDGVRVLAGAQPCRSPLPAFRKALRHRPVSPLRFLISAYVHLVSPTQYIATPVNYHSLYVQYEMKGHRVQNHMNPNAHIRTHTLEGENGRGVHVRSAVHILWSR